MSERRFLIILILITLGLAVFRPETGFWVRERLVGPREPSADDMSGEVAALKAELARRELAQHQLPRRMEGRALGEVYSRYPFGLKSEFLVNVGEADGVRAGQPALSGGVFVGSVVKAFARAALVQTLFDARAKYPVRIGKKGVDALLVGGGEPRLTLIANAAVLAEGDAVYTASPSLPFGLSVGVVGTVREGRDGLFREAEIALPYNPAEVRAVEIMTEYEPPSF